MYRTSSYDDDVSWKFYDLHYETSFADLRYETATSFVDLWCETTTSFADLCYVTATSFADLCYMTYPYFLISTAVSCHCGYLEVARDKGSLYMFLGPPTHLRRRETLEECAMV